MKAIRVKNGKFIGDKQPVYIIAEIGINHNGSLETAKKMVEAAAHSGADAVKFQKRTPEVCVPKDQWNIERETPWGRMTYIDYRYKVEFGEDDYREIDYLCKKLKIDWFVSCWDEPAVDFIEEFDTPIYKLASASLTDFPLIEKVKLTDKPFILSTGMSTMEEIEASVNFSASENLMLAHATSSYPCDPQELNLRMILTLKNKYPEVLIGYSGHETGLATTLAAVTLGACFVERHFTLDRAMWGSDQAASVEPQGMERLVRDIRHIEESLGDGIKKVYESEMSQRKKLRRVKEIEMK
jgi:N-acetylneuraminate synthase